MTVRVAAVMSTFRPEASIRDNARAAAAQVDDLIIVDDTGGPSAVADLVGVADLPGVTVLANEENLGLAASLNRGVRSAIERGATQVVTLDDDTHLPPGYVAHLIGSLRDAQEAGLPVLAAGPRRVNGGLGAYNELHRVGDEECSLYVMQSGLAIDVRAFEQVGWFREEFFIDEIEPDFLARLHRIGQHVLLVPDLDLPHVVGEPRVVDLGFRTVTASNHAAFRVYYITRNMLTFAREHRDDEPVVARQTRSFVVRELTKVLLLEHDKRDKLRAAYDGFRDYRRGRLGRRPESR